MLSAMNLDICDCEDPGRESLIETASELLVLCRYPEFFIRSGIDVGSGEIVSICSLLSSEEDLAVGENSGRGIGTVENSV
jgi:hypothetical protein